MKREPSGKRAASSVLAPGRRRWALLLIVVLAAGGSVYLLRQPLLTGLGWMLVVADPLEKADAAVVLGGDASHEGHRVRAAVRLYRQGWVRKVILSGPEWGYGFHETELSVPLAVSQGVPKSDLMPIPNSVRSTWQEAQLLAEMLERRGIRSLYVVTSNYHTRRARRAFLRASGGRLRVLAYPAPDDWFEPRHWWQSREGRKIFVLECLKHVNSLLE